MSVCLKTVMLMCASMVNLFCILCISIILEHAMFFFWLVGSSLRQNTL